MKTTFDLAIVGGGLTGLVTALLYSQTSPQKRVLLLEKNSQFGGLALTDSKDPYHFDSVYIFPDISPFLNHLGLKSPLTRYKETIFHYNFIDGNQQHHTPIPADRERLGDSFCRLFPEDREKITTFLTEIKEIYDQFETNLKTKLGPGDIIHLLLHSGKLLKAMNMTLDHYIDSFHFHHKELVQILSALSGITALPKERLNALVAIIGLESLFRGATRQETRVSDLIEEILGKLRRENVSLQPDSEVCSITKERGLFTLIERGGQTFKAKKVITTTDTQKTFLSLVDQKLLPRRFVNKVKNLTMTHSVFMMRLIVKESCGTYPSDVGQLLYYKGEEAFAKLFAAADQHKETLNEDHYHFALAVREQPGTDHCSIELITLPVSWHYWQNLAKRSRILYQREVEKWEEFYLDKLVRHFDPQIKSKIILKKSSTPLEMSDRFGYTSGSIYDMAYTPNQTGLKRIALKTPVKNLFHSRMIHGVYGAFFQAFLLCDLLTGGAVNNYGYDFSNITSHKKQ